MNPRAFCLLPVALLLLGGLQPTHVTATQSATAACPVFTGEPQNPEMTLQPPGDYAWTLFAFLNTPADPNHAGQVDSNNNICSSKLDVDTVWESWPLANLSEINERRSEVYLMGGKRPADWNAWNRPGHHSPTPGPGFTEAPDLPGFARDLIEIKTRSNGQHTEVLPLDVRGNYEEVRINRGAYETIVSNNLYNAEGIRDAIRCARQRHKFEFVEFPATAKEIKASWLRLCDEHTDVTTCAGLKARYHWRTIQEGAQSVVVGLAALHIMTKDIHDNWYWADFVHQDCIEPGSAGLCSEYGSNYQSNIQKMKTSSAPQWAQGSSTPWKYYRLNGTETSFTDATGNEGGYLANRTLELGAAKSSCITCHGYASASVKINGQLGKNSSSPTGIMSQSHPVQTGAPDCKVFNNAFLNNCTRINPLKQSYYRSGFDWSMIIRAHSIHEKLPTESADNPRVTPLAHRATP